MRGGRGTAKIQEIVQKRQNGRRFYGKIHRIKDGEGIAIFADLVYNKGA